MSAWPPPGTRADPPVTHLLYLHGFRSSPRSHKAQRTAAALAALRDRGGPAPQWWCPALPESPQHAMALVSEGIAAWPAASMAVIGSSLGGFYATVVAERTGCRAVVLNPAVDPARDLAQQVGPQTLWHAPAQGFEFAARYLDELRALTPGPLTRPGRYLAVIAEGDEVLDAREMVARYAGARLKVLPGGDHALSDYEQHLPDVLAFLQLTKGHR